MGSIPTIPKKNHKFDTLNFLGGWRAGFFGMVFWMNCAEKKNIEK